MSFENLKLKPELLKAISETGYTIPTPVQSRAIPEILAGHDLLVSSQTGSGKTAAFMLPALQRLSSNKRASNGKGPRVLVLTPTRELASQITRAVETYGKHIKPLNVVSILGGVPYQQQRRRMKIATDVMLATPGRLIDYMNQGQIDFSDVELVVLDEADRMLDMGFRDAVSEILQATPKKRQTLLFSATIDASINRLAHGFMQQPQRIEINAQQMKHKDIEETMYVVKDPTHKKELLLQILKGNEVYQAIIFTATKSNADRLARDLCHASIDAAALHGDMPQGRRNRTVADLRTGKTRVLVATDLAARGIDVPTITHIINYDPPRVSEDYVHRIGRTGRAGAKGTAISFFYSHEKGALRRIERFIGRQIPSKTPSGFTERSSGRKHSSGAPTEHRQPKQGHYGRPAQQRAAKPFHKNSNSSHPRPRQEQDSQSSSGQSPRGQSKGQSKWAGRSNFKKKAFGERRARWGNNK